MPTIEWYHFHIYFDLSTRGSAAKLRDSIIKDLSGQVRAHGLIDEPIGPHPLPMFEVDVPTQNLAPVKKWLEQHHGSHSVLIHPLTGDDLADHSDHPQWIGKPLPLDLEFLKRLK